MISSFSAAIKGVFNKKIFSFCIQSWNGFLGNFSPCLSLDFKVSIKKIIPFLFLCLMLIFFTSYQGISQCTFITNGTFDTDLSGWTSSGNLEQDRGLVRFSRANSTPDGILAQTISLTTCNAYELTLDLGFAGSNNTQEAEIFIDGISQGVFAPATTVTLPFTAQQASVEIRIEDRTSNTNGQDLTLDNVEVCLTADNAASTDPVLEVTLTDPADVEICGDMAVISVMLEYGDTYPGEALTTIDGTITLPSEVTPNAIANVSGGTITVMPPNLIDVSDMEPGDVITFDIEIDATCGVADPFTYTVDFTYDEVCPGADVMTSTTSGSVDVSSPAITISNSSPPFFNGQIGFVQMITNTVSNTGDVDVQDGDLTYCILDFGNATLTDVTLGGASLTAATMSPAGQTCYTIPGALAVGGTADIIETWTMTSCDPANDAIMRRASYGCEGDIDCEELPQEQFPSTDITLSLIHI